MGEAPHAALKARLKQALAAVANDLSPFLTPSPDFNALAPNICRAYEQLGAMWLWGQKSPVGATKILHFLLPEAFVIVDSNVRKSFNAHYGTPLRYSCGTYLKQLSLAHKELQTVGPGTIQLLGKSPPLSRLFDKVAFAKAARWC